MATRWWKAGLVLMATIAAGVLAQISAPATVPAVDQTTPKNALKTLAHALDSGQRQLVLEVLLADNDTERRLTDAMAELAVVTALLRDAAVKAFGADQCRVLGVEPAADSKAMRRIDEAAEEIEADHATIRPKDPGGQPIVLEKREGTWRVPVREMIKDVESAAVDQNLHDMARQTRLMRELSSEIATGRFKSAVDARQELDRRIVSSSVNPATGASTAPSQQR